MYAYVCYYYAHKGVDIMIRKRFVTTLDPKIIDLAKKEAIKRGWPVNLLLEELIKNIKSKKE